MARIRFIVRVLFHWWRQDDRLVVWPAFAVGSCGCEMRAGGDEEVEFRREV